MEAFKQIASLSIDLDNQWSYMKTHGDAGWELYPSYLDLVVPRVLNFLEERDLKITFFVVGRDAAMEKNHAAIKAIAAAGHEIGNHTFNHEPWLHLCDASYIEEEITSTEQQLQRLTGQRPIGFRGPGYSISSTIMTILAQHGYMYDGSTFPSYLGPLARTYYFMTAKLTPEEKAQRSQLFGTFRDGLRTNHTYVWRKNGTEVIEIPVTTMPVLKLPIHISYVVYLSIISTRLALAYINAAIRLCEMTHIEPSLLLHPLDFLGADDNIPEMAFFPGMNLSSAKKLHVVSESLRMLAEKYNIVTMRQHALAVGQSSTFPVLGLR
jgi:hypothetical protein